MKGSEDMSAIKRYIWDEAEDIANEFGLKVDDIADEIFSYITDRSFSTDDAIKAVRVNITAAPLKIALYKACGVPLGKPVELTAESVTCSDGFERYSNCEVNLRAPNPIFPSLPITERSANDIAKEIQESIRRKMK